MFITNIFKNFVVWGLAACKTQRQRSKDNVCLKKNYKSKKVTF